MSEARQNLGRWGEDLAARYLERCGWRILHRNLRTPVGEIDILARDGKTLVFVEVKTRRGLAFGTPQEAVGPAKRRQILRAAQWHLAAVAYRTTVRFDVVAILAGSGEPRIEHIVDAFGQD
ncbi:YraN family protein [Trichloromonas sp.]|uniref:YraN family protein n=1 Tax=Trichloromonas sp. TaxID=3069249 RepID=UPI002A4AD0F4|nr:YraN family protein [Trichloromonas sp.]